MGQGVRTGLGHGGITCVLQTQFSSLYRLCKHDFQDSNRLRLLKQKHEFTYISLQQMVKQVD